MVVFGALTSGLEIYWRSAGHRPSVADTPGHWANQRKSVYPRYPGETVLVLAGGSRIQLGISMEELRLELPHVRAAHLAIDGSDPFPTLQNLSHDPGFSGLVLLSATSEWLVDRTGRGSEYVSHYVNTGGNINQGLNHAFGARFQDALVVRSASVSLQNVLSSLVASGELPDPQYAPMRWDRSRPADYSKLDVEFFRAERIRQSRQRYERWEQTPPSISEFRDSVVTVSNWIEAIRDRGGNVALVHFPIEGELLDLSRIHFPKEVFWDAMANELPCPVVHFLDEPGLQGFSLPDASHIDRRDAGEFTRALIRVLRGKDFF